MVDELSGKNAGNYLNDPRHSKHQDTNPDPDTMTVVESRSEQHLKASLDSGSQQAVI